MNILPVDISSVPVAFRSPRPLTAIKVAKQAMIVYTNVMILNARPKT